MEEVMNIKEQYVEPAVNSGHGSPKAQLAKTSPRGE
jgi:hypothetical protein